MTNTLYLIGGAARAGKTMLAHRLLHERQVPYICLDYLVTGLERGAPSLGIVGESANRERAERLWPILSWSLTNIVLVEPAYTVEGDALWPDGVAALREQYPDEVHAVFLGYAETTPAEKLAQIRTYSGEVNDWVQRHDDAYIRALAEEMIGWSRFVREACARHGLPYVDVSVDFLQGVTQAYQVLTKQLQL